MTVLHYIAYRVWRALRLEKLRRDYLVFKHRDETAALMAEARERVGMSPFTTRV